jgi:hypothetical protein
MAVSVEAEAPSDTRATVALDDDPLSFALAFASFLRFCSDISRSLRSFSA